MVCPKCGGKVAVVDIAHNTESNETYRRKKCLACGHRFHTVEFEAEYDENFKSEWLKYVRHNKFRK